MSQANQYYCKVFLKNLSIQQEIIIDNDTQIVPSVMGYTCYDSAKYMTAYLETVTGEKVNIDIEKLAKEYSRGMPVCVIKLWNVKAQTLETAAELAVKKSEPIIKFLTYHQIQSPALFGVTATSKEQGTFVAVLPATCCRWKIYLMDDVNAMARYIAERAVKDERLNLFLTLFSDAVSESNLDFRIVKLWTILETIATSYVGKKEHKVRELLSDFKVGIPKYEKYDLIELAYKHRNAVIHEGNSDPELASAEYAKFLSVSSPNRPRITQDLQELINFVIRLYCERSPKEQAVNP